MASTTNQTILHNQNKRGGDAPQTIFPYQNKRHADARRRQRPKSGGRRSILQSRRTRRTMLRRTELVYAATMIFVVAFLVSCLRPSSDSLLAKQLWTDLINENEDAPKQGLPRLSSIDGNADGTLPQNYSAAEENVNSSSGATTDAAAISVLPPKGRLRFDWSNLELKSEFAKRLYANQHNCSIPVAHCGFWGYGLGSDLHVYGTRLVRAMMQRYRLRTMGTWAWLDMNACEEEQVGGNRSISCYFTNVEPVCGDEEEVIEDSGVRRSVCLRNVGIEEEQVGRTRASIAEYIFSSVSKLVVDEAERQLNLVFPNGIVPSNLICVHIRWGDKGREMDLLETEHYIQAVEHIVHEANLTDVHILLCTEDPKAVTSFQKLMPNQWKLYLDHFYTMYLPYRENRNVTYSIATKISKEKNGKPGLWAFASVLVAMEANYFVLTTKSNWSRILNELRRAVVDPRCDGCTRMVDLRSGDC